MFFSPDQIRSLKFSPYFASLRLCVQRSLFILAPLAFSGCATAPVVISSQDDPATQQSLSQAASQLTQPGGPDALNAVDEAQVEWNLDRSMKVTVHQMWAARVKPDHPLPPLATLNLDSQDLTVNEIGRAHV